jgi:NodT family efflux transporter outer membrane factor (OMF) lipoprotein
MRSMQNMSHRVAAGTSSRQRLAGAVVAALLAAGCALKPAPTHDATLQAALPPDTRVPDAWVAGGRPGTVANGWLAELNDPGAAAMVAEAIAKNPDLRAAADRVQAAQQAAAVAGSRMLPWVGAVAGGNITHDDGGNTNESSVAYLSVAWEADVWGRLRARRAAAEASAEATALEYAQARQSLAATAARLWYGNTEANQLVALAEQAVAVYQQLVDLVQIRTTYGKVSNLDLAFTRAKLETAQGDLESARAAQGEARRGLEILLGRYPAATLRTAPAFPALPPPPALDVPGSLLLRRPDLLAAEHQALSAFRQQESAELDLLPAFSLSLTGGRLGDQVMTLLDLNPWLTGAGVGVTVPIFEGGRLRAQVAIATAQEAAAVAIYGSSVLRAFGEVENSVADDALYAARLPYEEKALADRTETVRIATIQYKAGKIDLLWVGELQTAEINNQQNLIKLVTAQRVNRIRMYLALGASYDSAPAARIVASAP